MFVFRPSEGRTCCQCGYESLFPRATLSSWTIVSPSAFYIACISNWASSRETAAGENATSYFPLLDRIADGSFAGIPTDKELYEKFLEVLQQDGHISSPDALSTFKFALSLRSAAPRVEAHYQYYDTGAQPSIDKLKETCPEWILTNGKQYCSSSLDGPGVSIAADS